MIYDILFAVVGIGLIAFGLSLMKLGGRVDYWEIRIDRHEQNFTNIEWHRAEDLGKLADLQQRVDMLEKRLEEKLNDSGGEE